MATVRSAGIKGVLMNQSETATLDQFQVGDQGIIQGYQGSSELHGRLRELGMVKGTRIVLERFAPLGDPLEISVRGYHLAIRRKDASQIVMTRKIKTNGSRL